MVILHEVYNMQMYNLTILILEKILKQNMKSEM